MENETVYIKGLGVESAFVYDFASRGEIFFVDGVGDTVPPEKSGKKVRVQLCMRGNPVPPEKSGKKDSCFLMLRDGTQEEHENGQDVFGGFSGLSGFREGVVVCMDSHGIVLFVCGVQKGQWQKKPDFAPVSAVLAVTGEEGEEKNEGQVTAAARARASFRPGDPVRFLCGTNYLQMEEVKKLAAKHRDKGKAFLRMESREYATVKEGVFRLRGNVFHCQEGKRYSLSIRCENGDGCMEYQEDLPDGEISVLLPLQKGANYITCALEEDGRELLGEKSAHIVFCRECKETKKEKIMWVEQYVNADATNSKQKIKQLILTAKNAGITAFALDLKGVEGYCSYQKASRTHIKYMTATPNPGKKITMEIDFLEEFLEEAHRQGMKVYGSFNFFVEGNLSTKDSAVDLWGTHPEWAEVLYVPEDNGRLKSVLETDRNCVLCYLNPADQRVWEFEAERVKEVLDHYMVDGIIMDRTRYDNQYADFSDVTKKQFEAYLAGKGKVLFAWPEDIYTFDQSGSMVYGRYYLDWLTFRSGVVKSFTRYLRGIIEEYQQRQGRRILLAAYVGSWYDLYYQNGVNWAGRGFVYNDLLNFPVPELYTEEYTNTSYLDALDFLMIGCYYDTEERIEKYVTIGNVVTGNQIPVLASISLPDLKEENTLCMAVKTCLDCSDGLMVFDLCYTDWEKMTNALR